MSSPSNQFIKETILKLLGAIGSEKEISKNFIQENFKQTYSYHEFEQINCNICYNNIFLTLIKS